MVSFCMRGSRGWRSSCNVISLSDVVKMRGFGNFEGEDD